MSKEHPILFSTPMVKAILAGTKTMTRRVIKPQPDHLQYHTYKGKVIYDGEHRMWCYKDMIFENLIDFPTGGEDLTRLALQCPYGKVGDILWVRETWKLNTIPMGWPYHYLAANDTFTHPEYEKWKPSIFMPKEACRIKLEITNIKVERLQDISPGDACDEGIEYWNIDWDAFEGGELQADFKNYTWKDDEKYEDYHFPTFASCIESYRTLWQSINGKESWNENPFVWAITFKKINL